MTAFLFVDPRIKNGHPQMRAAVLHLVHGLAYFALGKTNVLGVLLAE